jgi:hypothetical protein
MKVSWNVSQLLSYSVDVVQGNISGRKSIAESKEEGQQHQAPRDCQSIADHGDSGFPLQLLYWLLMALYESAVVAWWL